MRYLKWIILSFFAFFTQIQLSTILNIPLNFLVILVYYYALKNISELPKKDVFKRWSVEMKVSFFGVLIGLCDDLLSGTLIGPSMFSKGTIAILTVESFSSIFFNLTPLLGVVAVVAITILDNIIILAFRMLFSSLSDINLTMIMKMIFSQAIMNLPFGIIIKGSGR